MDEAFYASLIEDANKATNTDTPIHLSVILSRKKRSSSSSLSKSVQVGVAAKVPRKRFNCEDKVQFSLKYFSFLDSERMFSNLDSLLTQLSPLGVVHLGCTESAEIKSANNRTQINKAKEVSKLLKKVSAFINSRYDVNAENGNDQEMILSHVLKTLPKEVQSINNSSSTGSTNCIHHNLDSVMKHLLGDSNDNNNKSNSNTDDSTNGKKTIDNYRAFKNDTRLFDDILAQKAIMLLLQMEDLTCLSNDRTKGTFEILPGEITSYLTMDRTAMECINLLPPSHAGISTTIGGSSETNSLFGVLNRCKTKMGARMLEMWLRQPCVSMETILYRQNAVGSMVEENGLGRDRLRDEGLAALRGVDLDGLCTKLSNFDTNCGGGTMKALEAMYKLHLFADKQLPILMEALVDLVPNGNGDSGEREEEKNSKDEPDPDKSSKGAMENAFAGLDRVMAELSKSIELVETVLDFDYAPREFLIKASFSEDLGEVRADLESVEQELQLVHDDMNQLWSDVSGESVGQVRLERDSSCVWQFRLIDANKLKILESKDLSKEVTVHRILKNGVYFSNKALRELASKKHDLLEDYERHQRQIVQDAMSVVVSYVPVLERASQLIAELDVLASLAHVAAFNPNGYCKPEMTDSDEEGFGITLKEARHPCVELQDNVNFIPNDFDLTYGSSSFLLVTGPNMGGKSTYIRSLGAIITMAQIGSYVPCSSAKINIVHHILARVGAGDVQDRGISTFMAEMLEASSILRTATKRSLIVIDELGRGTSTFDGYGLASAISEYIVRNIGCMTVFATHFHELTSLEESEKVVNNCHVTAHRATDGSNGLSFLYEVRPGPCLESFGIQVAEMANVPKSVVVDAKRKAAELENFDCSKRRKREIVVVDDGGGISPSIESDLRVLNVFKNLPFGSMDIDEQMSAVTKLLQ